MNWLHPRNFTRAERGWMLGFFVVAAFLSTLQYIVFFAQTPPEGHYTWASVFYYDDYFQYYAWANHIAGGEWLIRNYYTGSDQAAFGLFNPYFLILGWITRLTGNVYFAYHFLRVAGIALFAFISYAFISLFLNEIRERRLAQILMLGGGLEYPFFLLNQTRPATPLADPYIYKVLYRYGHLTFALCLVLLIFGCYVHALSAGKQINWRSAALLALLTLTLGLVNPYYVVLVGAVIAFHTIGFVAKQDRRPVALALGVFTGGALAYLHYRIQSLSANLGAIAFDDPINLFDFVLFFAILLPLAVVGWIVFFRSNPPPETRKRQQLLIEWPLAVIALVILPLEFKARMVFGLGIALAIPAARLLARRSLLHPLYLPVYALLLIDLGFTFYKEQLDFHQQGVGQIPRAMLAAFDELDRVAEPGDLVLSHGDTGNFIPAYSGANVYIGHSFQTENYYEKAREFEDFMQVMGERQSDEFLDRIGARFLFIGPNARALNPGFDFPSWNKLYDRNGYTIYENPQARADTR